MRVDKRETLARLPDNYLDMIRALQRNVEQSTQPDLFQANRPLVDGNTHIKRGINRFQEMFR